MLVTLDGTKIKELRKQKGLTLKQFEALTGISDSYLSDIENEVPLSPSLDAAVSIAKALRTPLEKIMKKVS
jgi:transcriptional regulator with XRE-family HTH domain